MKTELFDNNLFCLMEQPGDDTIEDDLLKLARLKPRHEVQLLNYYKEVPVSATASILRVAEGTLVCRTSEAQSRVIGFSEYTIVKGAPFRHHAYANARRDPDSGEVVLSGLSYVDVHSIRRASIRVRMQVPPVICIEAGGAKISGRLLDLSLDGCAVNIADQTLLEKFSFFYLTIDMRLKTQASPIQPRIMAKLVKVYPHNKLFRCVFLFQHDKSSEDRIGMIIARRQAEIIRELTC